MANDTATTDHPDMDYAEHDRTYSLFITIFKWGTAFSIGCILLLAFLTL